MKEIFPAIGFLVVSVQKSKRHFEHGPRRIFDLHTELDWICLSKAGGIVAYFTGLVP